MKDYNVEISFKDKETGETVFQMNLEDLNSIQENVIKAQIGLNDGEKVEDKIVKDPDNYVSIGIGDSSLLVVSFGHLTNIPITEFSTIGELQEKAVDAIIKCIKYEPNLVCEDDIPCIHRMCSKYIDFAMDWFDANHEQLLNKISSMVIKQCIRFEDDYIEITIGEFIYRFYYKCFSSSQTMIERIIYDINTSLVCNTPSIVNIRAKIATELYDAKDYIESSIVKSNAKDYIESAIVKSNSETISEKNRSCCNTKAEQTANEDDDDQDACIGNIEIRLRIRTFDVQLKIGNDTFTVPYAEISNVSVLKTRLCEIALTKLENVKSSQIIEAINFINYAIDTNPYDLPQKILLCHDNRKEETKAETMRIWKERDYEPYV